MAERLRDTSDDRLPWLTEVPKAAPAPAPAPVRKRSLPLLTFLLGALFALIGVGAYWLGNRSGVSDVVSEERPGMAAQAETSAQAEAEGELAEAEPLPLDTPEALFENLAQPASPVPPSAQQIRQGSTGPTPKTAPARPRRVVPREQAEAAAEPETPEQPVVRGRIVQTGAFVSRQQAQASWEQMVRKWPYLATKPLLISPLDVRSTDGKETRMYRVLLATASQAQSEVICQRLQSARQSCVVVY
ncbi:SPOR domain-containing protein [Sphingomonas sp. BN140010]|uniref:SPOR domain-containing protein n=1 Tax=Sphingomonas arvum TaxID=2992113 RepID=A0ABT3JH36_9SPHN|nr:SPOR domain-containing protein [Sphingomonas sp. BN140010]MCW3798344.1 SPOR domain-containing protein [Sphingomonas sp. BN140010]